MIGIFWYLGLLVVWIRGNFEGARNRVTEGLAQGWGKSYVSSDVCNLTMAATDKGHR